MLQQQKQRSLGKNGDIYIELCDNDNDGSRLYSINKDPVLWKSCDDAYDYTWNNDFNNHLRSISKQDRIKLIRSMGYCPHKRCQLDNLDNAHSNGTCPEGLCYTKIENGGLSFGACCFINGYFNTSKLIGVYNKSQHKPKPIYKHSRIVIGDTVGGLDTSIESFMNANMIYPGIIAAQCPLTGYPSDYVNTVEDTKKMMIQFNVTKWIQLAPSIDTNIDPIYAAGIELGRNGSLKGNCAVFPILYFNDSNNSLARGISNFIIHKHEKSLVNLSYSLTGYTRYNEYGKYIIKFDDDDDDDESNWDKKVVHVNHLWYYSWKDFQIPSDDDINIIRDIGKETVQGLDNKSHTVISCLSGRGRTGTFAAVVIGSLTKVKTVSELVDIIVKIRENRDSMVETPEQFRFINRVLKLPDTSQCGLKCLLSNQINNFNYDLISGQTLSIVSFIAGLLFSQLLRIVLRLYNSSIGNYKHKKDNYML